MLEIILLFYFADVFHYLKMFMLAIILGAGFFLSFIMVTEVFEGGCREASTLLQRAKPYIKHVVIAMLASAAMFVALPSRITMYTIVGTYGISKSMDTLHNTETGRKLLEIVDLKLSEIIQESKCEI